MKQSPINQSAHAPPVSIILPTLNGMPLFAEVLDQLAAQDYAGAVEYIHIDSNSTDDTRAAAAARNLQTRVIDRADFHHGGTRNLGAELARHEILVFLSQDAIPAGPHWLARLAAPFADPRVGGVYGRQAAPPGMGALRRHMLETLYPMAREVREPEMLERPSLALYRFSNANSALRRSAWEALRFTEKAAVCEDQCMCRDLLRAGHRVVYEPEAAVWHAHERSVFEEYQWGRDCGRALTQVGILGDPAMGSEARYGIQRMTQDIAHFLKRGRPHTALHCLLINAARWLGVQAGKRSAA